jgi:hypothetical protein
LRALSDSLGQTAAELADLVSLGDRLELMVARLMASQAGADVELMTEAQGADLLSQRLAGVAAFVAGLAEAAPADAYHDVLTAARGLTLAEQAARLTGAAGGAGYGVASGELALFED